MPNQPDDPNQFQEPVTPEPVPSESASDFVGEFDTDEETAFQAKSNDTPDLESLYEDIMSYVASFTLGGLFPLVTYGVDQRGHPNLLGFANSSINDLPFALDLLERFSQGPVHPGRFLPAYKLRSLARASLIMKYREQEFIGLDTKNPEHLKVVRKVIAFHSASRWEKRSFLLVDIVGFSLYETPEQLSLRISLGVAINQCMRRLDTLSKKGFVAASGFNRVSTGDGFYLWNYDSSSEGHVTLFLLMVLLMAQSERMRADKGSNLRLRAAFGIGEAYTFPYEGPSAGRVRLEQRFQLDAIGPVLNRLNRLLSSAAPSQILVSPFCELGRENRPQEKLNLDTMLNRVRDEIMPSELVPAHGITRTDLVLNKDPITELRVSDKHGETHHCYNVCGRVPAIVSEGGLRLFHIGVSADPGTPIERLPFRYPEA